VVVGIRPEGPRGIKFLSSRSVNIILPSQSVVVVSLSLYDEPTIRRQWLAAVFFSFNPIEPFRPVPSSNAATTIKRQFIFLLSLSFLPSFCVCFDVKSRMKKKEKRETGEAVGSAPVSLLYGASIRNRIDTQTHTHTGCLQLSRALHSFRHSSSSYKKPFTFTSFSKMKV